MAELTPRARRTLLLLGVLYAVVNTFIGVHKGGDLTTEMAVSDRLLAGLPLYDQVNPAIGLPWPPFATVALVPFALVARLSLPLAKAVWAVGNVALFGWCLVRLYAFAGRWAPVVLGVAAVAQPLQSNFQHLNINIVLLALVMLAIGDLARERELRAALWIGAAAALKGYPGVIFLYFAVRGRWRPLVAGLAAAAGLTLLAGPSAVLDYARLAITAPSTRGLAGQAMGGLVTRLGGDLAIALALNALAIAGTAVTLWRHRAAREPVRDVGLAALLAVLLSPLDRLHFYVLALPAWVDTFARPARERGWRRTAWVAVAAVGALLTSGMLSQIRTPLPEPLRAIRRNTYNLGALVLLAIAVTRRAPLPGPEPAGEPT